MVKKRMNTDRSEEEILALLPGKGQPDPLILLELAPLVPAYLIPRAIQVALYISYPDLILRAAIVEKLAGRLTAEDGPLLEETLVAARRVLVMTDDEEPALLLTLAPLLPSHLTPHALELALRIVNYDTRTDVLATLAGRLSPASQESILSAALDSISTQKFESFKAAPLIKLARHLPYPLMGKAIRVARSLQDKQLRAQSLSELAKYLPSKKRAAILNETLTLIRSFKNKQDRSLAIIRVAPLLSTEQIPEALEMARKMGKTTERVYTMAILAAFVTGSEKQVVINEVLKSLRKIGKADVRARVLAELAPLLPQTERRSVLDQIVGYVHQMRQEESEHRLPPGLVDLSSKSWDSWENVKGRASGLGKLASRLPEEEQYPWLNEAVSEALLIRETRARSIIFKELEPILPLSLLEEVRKKDHSDQVQQVKETKALLELPLNQQYGSFEFANNLKFHILFAQKLPEEERSALVSELLKKSRLLTSKKWQANSIIALASLIPEKDHPDLIIEVTGLISLIEDPKDRAELSAELIPLLPESLREQRLAEIFDFARLLKNEISKSIILEGLIPVVTTNLVSDLMDITGSLKSLKYRISALVKIAAYFPPSVYYRQMEEAFAGLSSCDPRERADLLAQLVPCLPKRLLMEALDLARRIRIRNLRAEAVSATLASLARQSPGAGQEEIVSEAMKEAFFITPRGGGRGGQSDPIGFLANGKRAVELLGPLPQDKRETLLQEWLGSTEKVPEDDFRISMKRAEPPSFKAEEEENSDLEAESLPAQERVVNTGFSDYRKADQSIDKDTPLVCGVSYYFWLEVGEQDPYSIEKVSTAIPIEHLPSEALLKVVLFILDDETLATPGADVGELILLPDGTARVNKQPVTQPDLLPADLADRRLFFPVTAPAGPGIFKLRCNIYYEQILVQARLIQVQVCKQLQPMPDALSSVVDYTLSHNLQPAHLNRLDSHRLSLMLNTSEGKTHALIFGGGKPYEAVLSPLELKMSIDNSRKALRKASWGDFDSWSGQQYKYKDQGLDADRLREDIISLAIGGFDLYNALIDKLTGGRKQSYQLADLMLSPGMVQIALKLSPNQVLPAALFYDYPLNTQANQHHLCDTFSHALQNKEPLDKTPCFNGACPTYDKQDYVCPSGFWGFRHFLGMPVSLGDNNYGRDVAPEIVLKGKTVIIVGAATSLDQLDEHMQKLQTFSGNLDWYYSEKSADIINLLKTKKSHIIYFYCHGILGANKALYLQVGNGTEYIDGSILRTNRILWDDPCPLVFINGCQTVAVDPEQSANLVQDFIGSGGAGVIGTEITVFEPLACGFAEECMRLFLSGKSIGEAVRSARLKLLQEGNPLGLVYTPFVIPSLHIGN